MKYWLIIILVLIGIVGLYLASSIIILYIGNQKVFGFHGSDPDNPCYQRFEDYDKELERDEYQCGYYLKCIRGYIYRKKDISPEKIKGFIILSHGLFGTHIQYMADIYLLCMNGYEVLAYDQYGCGISDGKSMEYLANGIYVCENVIHDVIKRNVNKDLPILLYGHSWGAYSVMGAMKEYPQIKGVIARSSPISPSLAADDLMKAFKMKTRYFLLPGFKLSLFFLLGFHNSVSAKRGLRKNHTSPVLLIQAKNDNMVLFKHSLAAYYLKKPKTNVSCFITENGLHNSIISEEGSKAYSEKVKEYKTILKDNSLVRQEEIEKFEAGLNRREMYPYQDIVKDKIIEFFDECIKK